MHIECVPKNIRNLLPLIGKAQKLYSFVLAGGTALALHLGHRTSVDLDFFSERIFSPERLFNHLRKLKLPLKILQEEKGTLTALIRDVKMSFFHYPYPFVEPKQQFLKVIVAGILDIASMKLVALSQRGTKRDFVDLYFILQNVPFRKVAQNLIKRYGKERVNSFVFGKSLVYFNDADLDPEPRYCAPVRPLWKNIKKFFMDNVRQMVLDLEQEVTPLRVQIREHSTKWSP